MSSSKKKDLQQLAGQVAVAGATYAGNRMMSGETSSTKPKKKHRVRRLIGLAMVAGAVYAGSRIIKSNKARKDKSLVKK